MALTPAQVATLKAAILADPVLAAQPMDGNGNGAIADAFNVLASPAFYVWRTSVSRADIYNGTPQPEGSSWSWTFYKNQSVTEQNAWVQMFMGDQADFSKANVRDGVTKIFTSASSANATHALAVARRQATRAEKLLASGTGSIAAPAVVSFEGSISSGDVDAARHS